MVVLNRDDSGFLYADENPIYDPSGQHIHESIYAGWTTLGAETIGDENLVLWSHTKGLLHYWHTDSSWSWQSGFGEYYDGSSEYYLAEVQFGIDVNGDGTLGEPLPEPEPQDFPPSVLPGSMISNLPSNYETSGLTWHEGMQKLFTVSDEGIVSMMDKDGSNLVHWNVPGDLEAITIADHTSHFVYIGVENPDSIIEFDVMSGQITRTFSLTNWMTGPANLGLEALTFVPDNSQPEGGYFYAGLQSSGAIYRFELPIQSSTHSATVTFIDTLQIEGDHADISGLTYDYSSGRILALFDSSDRIKVIERNGKLRTQWHAPGSEQEAIFYAAGDLFIGEDFGSNAQGIITKYTPFTLIVA